MRASLITLFVAAFAVSTGCESTDKNADTGADTGADLFGGEGEGEGEGAGTCGGQGVLVHYKEGGDPEDVFAYQAALSLGMDVRATKHDEDFVAELTTNPPALLIIDAPVARPDDEEVLPHVQDFLDTGNPALIGISDLHRDTPWNEVLGVDGDDQWDSREIYAAPGADTNLFAGEQQFPEGMRGPSSSWAIDGHALTSRDGSGVPLAVFDSTDGSEVAIMSMRDGQLIVNGLFGDVFKRVDNDEDELPDAMELYVNEIMYVTGCTPAE